MNMSFKQKLAAIGIAAGLIGGTGCSTGASARMPQMAPPEVEVATVEQRDVPVYHEWIGTLDGMVNAAIKAQVSGYLLSQNYTEGSFVRKGQSLFEIDPRPFEAAVAQAMGQLAQAKGQLAQAKAQLTQAKAQLDQAAANQKKAQLDEDRYTPLAKQQAITQQDFDNSVQTNVAAKAQMEAGKAGVETAKAQIEASNAAVEAAQAAVDAAKVNNGFVHLTAPIDGIVGQAQVQVGNLVGPASGTITMVSTLDPIKANFTVGEQEYLKLGKSIGKLELELILADGTPYAHRGKVLFADRQVNQSTGSIQLMGVFPNPGNVLRPGQYAKVRAAVGTVKNALLVPQRSISELQGTFQVALVDSGNKVEIRNVTPGERIGSQWIVTDGLHAGERVIAEGVMKIGPGAPVVPKPFHGEEVKGN
jgi:RND family efflux transporter MFP subunit